MRAGSHWTGRSDFGRLRLALAGGLTAMCLVATAIAAEVGVSASNARLETTPGNAGEARIFLTITNATGAADRLVGAELDAKLGEGAAVAIAPAVAADGAAEATATAPDGIDIPAGTSLELRPATAHLIATGFSTPTEASGEIALTLRFEQAGEIVVTALVTQASTTASAAPTAATVATPSTPPRKTTRARRAEKAEAPARRKKRANRGSH
ncbi:MAG: copper chaperone PCu(A)C [Rhizobiales bacterium]|nr:copper chaperone PCu(A)C [Hyphomicrobiales bacterium]